MSDSNQIRSAAARILDTCEVEEVLSQSYYDSKAPLARTGAQSSEPKPTHYKVICISLYTDDLERLDAMVSSLKQRGLTKANRSALIRHALNTVDLESMPKGI